MNLPDNVANHDDPSREPALEVSRGPIWPEYDSYCPATAVYVGADGIVVSGKGCGISYTTPKGVTEYVHIFEEGETVRGIRSCVHLSERILIIFGG